MTRDEQWELSCEAEAMAADLESAAWTLRGLAAALRPDEYVQDSVGHCNRQATHYRNRAIQYRKMASGDLDGALEMPS